MELLEERGKNKVTHRYVDFVSREDSASKGVIPKRGDETSALPPKDQIKIPPRARDGQTFKTDNELSQEEMLKKIRLAASVVVAAAAEKQDDPDNAVTSATIIVVKDTA